jgi:hypothetical protein
VTQLLKNSRTKIARAREQLEGLQAEFQRFSDSKPYTVRQEHDLETEEFILVYYPSARIPDTWTVIIGEVFHNLRSALDQAIYELTIRENGSPLEKTEFPVFDDPRKFAATKRNGDPAPASGAYRIRGLSQKTRDIIEQMQPYHFRQPDNVSFLDILHEMSIVDKHREIHLCRTLAVETRIEMIRTADHFINWAMTEIGANLDERTVIARLKLGTGLDENLYMDATVSIDIFFDQSCCTFFKRNEKVTDILDRMIKGTERVLHYLEISLTD